MKKILIIILIAVLVTGYGCRQKDEVINSKWWKDIVGKEFVNYDIWAGNGLVFYESEGKPYCDYVVYGSGLPVIYTHSSKLTQDDDGTVIIKLPENIIIGTISEETPSEKEREYKITVSQGSITIEDRIYLPVGQ